MTNREIQKQAAEQELKRIKKSDIYLYAFMSFCSLVGIIYGIFSHTEKSGSITIVSVVLFILFLNSALGLYNRRKSLENIISDTKVVLICPNCKSPSIKQRFVRNTITRGHSRTYKSKNINPFKPFTNTNYDTKPVKTNVNYKTTYECQICGNVFDTPQTFEYQ